MSAHPTTISASRMPSALRLLHDIKKTVQGFAGME
jgi:hypothetical protein